MSDAFNTETIEHRGITVQIEYFYDQDAGKPWENCDGHGVMREAYSYYDKPEKKPGEVLIHSDRGNYWIYDIQETTKIARRDGWGFESFNDYHITSGHEMAHALAETVHTAKLKNWRSALTEARARKYWASRDVVTVGALHA